MFGWDPETYERFLKERTQPSIDLAAKIPLSEPKSIIDIGCGPGNSTRVLKERFPNARVIGADSSAEMVAKAREGGGEFIQLDASRELRTLGEKFDVVFSNACIQWVPDHPVLLRNMMNLLNEGGVLAVQTPMNYEEPIHQIISRLVQSEKWRGKFDSPRIFYNLKPSEYFDILAEIASDFTMWHTIYCHRMPSHDSIIDWYKGTGLRPYLAALSETDAAEFEAEVYGEVVKEYPVQKNGEIIFRFPRFFFIATK